MFGRHFYRKSVLRLCVLSLAMPTLGSCEFFDKVKSVAEEAGETVKSWAGEAGNTIVNFFTGPVSDWWNGLIDGASKIYDDVSGAVVDGFNTFATGVADCYESVKDGVVTFYNGAIEKFKIKEVDRSTEDYALVKDDNEARVYAILDQQLCSEYSVFPAYVYHPLTNELIDGIGFSSETECYVDEGGASYFGAGFLSGIGEIELDSSALSEGVEIIRPGNESGNKYVYTHEVEPFKSHFISNQRYVRFGVGERNNLLFEEEETDNYGSESDYGGLFNFDTGKWVFGDNNDYVRPDGNILDPETLDTTKIMTSLGSKDGRVDCTFSVSNLINGASNVISELKTRIANMGRMVLGNDAMEVVDSLSHVKASDIFSVDGSKFTFQGIPEAIGTIDVNSLAKGLAIGGTILSLALTLVFTVVEKIIPLFAIFKGVPAAMLGCCMDVLLQMCLEKKNINDVNWVRMIVNSVCTVIGVYTNGMVGEKVANAVAESVVAFVDGGEALGGVGMIFLKTFLSSIIVSGIFSLISKGASKAFNFIKARVSKEPA